MHEHPTKLTPSGEHAPKATRALRLGLSVCAMAALSLLAAVGAAREPVRIPVIFHVAQREGQSVAAPSFIAEQLAAANAIYKPLGIELVEQQRVPLAARHADLVTRGDRDALSSYARKGVIDCFVVAKLMDVDEPGRERRGVHWRPRPKPRHSFVIVSKISKPYVLAHELGHFFGNREHSAVPGNLMSYTRTNEPPFLDSAQAQRVQRTLEALVKGGRLVPLAKAARATR